MKARKIKDFTLYHISEYGGYKKQLAELTKDITTYCNCGVKQPPLVVKLCAYEDSRTLRQNAYFHGVMMEDIMAGLVKQGKEMPYEVVKNRIKLEAGFVKVYEIDGLHTPSIKSTTKMTIEEMSQLIEAGFKFGAENAIEIREANYS